MSAALLTYRLTPASARAGVPVTLTVTATNETAAPVECREIVLAVPLAEGAAAAAVLGSAWTVTDEGGGSFAARPVGEVALLGPGDTVALQLVDVRVEQAAPLAVSEDGRPAPPLELAVVRDGPSITSFVAIPPQPIAGGGVLLAWTTEGAEACELASPDGSQAVPPQGHLTVTPAATTVYVLTASGGGGAVTGSLLVAVPPPTILSFGAAPATVAPGTSSMLVWRAANAAAATLDQGVGAVPPEAGTVAVAPAETTTYTLAVRAGEATAEATATVSSRSPRSSSPRRPRRPSGRATRCGSRGGRAASPRRRSSPAAARWRPRASWRWSPRRA